MLLKETKKFPTIAFLLIALALPAAAVSDSDRKIIVSEMPQTPIVEKVEKHKVYVVKSGRSSAPDDLEIRQKALKDAEEQLEETLKDLRSDYRAAESEREKEILSSALRGVEGALESLRAEESALSGTHIAHFDGGDGESKKRVFYLERAISDLETNEIELGEMRTEMREELQRAREEIQDALGDLELELDLDGDVQRLHFRALKEAEEQLVLSEKEQIEALIKAEKDIREKRKELEKKLKKMDK